MEGHFYRENVMYAEVRCLKLRRKGKEERTIKFYRLFGEELQENSEM